MLRSALLRLPVGAALRTTAPRRFASSGLPAINGQQLEEAGAKILHDPRIPAGVTAIQWDVPSELPKNAFNERRQAVEDHAVGSTDLWRKISFYICLPGVAVIAVWVYQAEMAHKAHHEHVVAENGGVEPERKVYSYMNMKTKPYPWGSFTSLFFNPKVNIPSEE